MDRPLIDHINDRNRVDIQRHRKAYFFFFGLVFTATLSIYRSVKSAGDGEGDLQGNWAVVYEDQFAPTRLEQPFSGGGVENVVSGATEEAPVRLQEPSLAAGNARSVGPGEGRKEGVGAQEEPQSTSAAGDRESVGAGKGKKEVRGAQDDPPSNKKDPGDDKPIPVEKPMNVVMLYADDWRHDSLGVAGNVVHTPFLDFLSTKGMRFTHNCVTTSVCWISRATLHTGMYYSRHKATRPKDFEWYDGWADTYPALFKEEGYHVAHIGKWHSSSFDKIGGTYDHKKIYYGKHWFPGNPRPIHVTERNERDALEMLKKRPKDKPFVLTLAFFAPHSWDGNKDQFLPQNKSMALYQNMTLKAPVDMAASRARLPKGIVERNEGRNRWRQRFDEPEKYDRMLKNYFRLISEVDGACESVWKELEKQGILNETLVIFSTDNGYYHGEHGLAGKWYPHEESIRVPLIVYDPRMPKSKVGTTDDSFTLNIDLAPTILGAANLTKPKSYQGRDISDLYLRSDTTPPWREEFFYEHPIHINQQVIPASSALVRKGIKYVKWPNFDTEQIFNLTSDPMEEEDQISNPAYAEIHAELKTRHDKLRDLVGQENTEF